MKKLKDINWNQVYYFYEVARKMSMKEAAEVTGVSIPTVSEQIKRLETLLETPLFHRRPRRIELTAEGETLYRHAQGMFESGRRFLDAVSPTAIGGYPVRVAVQESFAASYETEFLAKYADAYLPFGVVRTTREGSMERICERLLEGSIDWAIVHEEPRSGRLERGRVGECEMAFMTAASALAAHESELEVFKHLPLARCRHDDALNRLVADRLQMADVFVEETIETDHSELCRRLAEAGQCVAALPKSLVAGEAGSGRLKAFSVGSPIVLPIFAVWRRSGGRMVAIRKLIELLETDTNDARDALPAPSAAKEGAPIELPHSFRHFDQRTPGI